MSRRMLSTLTALAMSVVCAAGTGSAVAAPPATTAVSAVGGVTVPTGGREVAVTPDARFAVFVTASRLSPLDTDNVTDVYRLERATGEVRLISPVDNDWSADPDISADGTRVVYRSSALGLQGIFFFDFASGHGGFVTLAGADEPRISDDGSTVVFSSTASALVANDTNNRRDVFSWSFATSAIRRVSVTSAGGQSTGPTEGPMHPQLSADGSVIAFQSTSSNLGTVSAPGTHVFVRNTVAATTRLVVDAPAVQPSINGSGTLVAYSTPSALTADDRNRVADVYATSLVRQATTRVSVELPGVSGAGDSDQPTISADGTVIAFRSASPALVTGDTNGVADIFVAAAGIIVRASVSSGGAQANGASSQPAISNAPGVVAFTSSATNLVVNDLNGADDAFVHVI